MHLPVAAFGFVFVAVLFTIQLSEAKPPADGVTDVDAGILPEMPSGCYKSDFCFIKHDNYPQPLIDELLENKFNLSLADLHEEEFSYRNGGALITIDPCPTKPQKGREVFELYDGNGNVRVVVQSKHFRQLIRMEKCRSSRPRGIRATILKHTQIQCVENKIHYKFLVLNRNGTGIESMTTKKGIPVSCSTKYIPQRRNIIAN